MKILEAENLVNWFLLHRRDLPWRNDWVEPAGEAGLQVGEAPIPMARDFSMGLQKRDPYATWISEIMLQQTQVATVIAYFNRWMLLFPDVAHLASAPESQVLEAWAGLGYYSRARNLLATAKTVMRDFGGHFPSTRQDLLALKGVGEYTAGAIASLAFNLPEPILDGNVIRVFSRFYALDFLPDAREKKAVYWDWAKAWVESQEPALVNEALMELGAMVCTPKLPTCGSCPLERTCQARAKGAQFQFPPSKVRKPPVEITGYVVVAQRNAATRNSDYKIPQEILLYRPSKPELLAGLWTFPFFGVTDLEALAMAWKVLLPAFSEPVFQTLGYSVAHSITHHRLNLEVVTAQVPTSSRNRADGNPKSEGGQREQSTVFQWVKLSDIDHALVSSLPRKVWQAYLKAAG